ncbi:MAG: L-serine ammonia-lyase, iron-sulfur-dependent, subunit alpha [Acholeplasmataceae bacterium]|nr:L-serine ammonia-lyase, iron-sulfur-dependent, subunit alpha [Acholeplasmataceae bacterium]
MKSIKSVFKIGHGPSSSHTMGPAIAAEKVKALYPNKLYKVVLYNSLALTGEGHLTLMVIKDILKNVTFDKQIDLSVHPNQLIFEVYDNQKLIKKIAVQSIGGGEIIFDGNQTVYEPIYNESTFDEIKAFISKNKLSLIDYIKKYETKDTFIYLEDVFRQMCNTIEEGLATKGVLPGELMVQRKANALFNNALSLKDGSLKDRTLLSAYAFATGEQNASGGLMVTAPTCGASGVLPAVLYFVSKIEGISKKKIIEALAIAGLIGNLIIQNASISGAVAGCQAEIGSACSMAAAAYAYIKGETIDQIEYAAEIAMEHYLGLTCDPVGGYVQIPCIERNAVAATRAINASELALVLFNTRKISFDMIVKTMYQTGLDMDSKYKETSEAGLAYFYKELEKRKKQ